MFNFHAESNAQVIFKAMKKEIIVADQIACPGLDQDIPKIGPHPNIVKMHLAFSDYVPHLSDSMELYPSALPSRINPNGYGRNMSLFMVMKRYQCNLQVCNHLQISFSFFDKRGSLRSLENVISNLHF